jgi:DNA-binding CsgD family transcriptional regulator
LLKNKTRKIKKPSVVDRHCRSLFDKLGVDKAVSAIHKAHIEGII